MNRCASPMPLATFHFSSSRQASLHAAAARATRRAALAPPTPTLTYANFGQAFMQSHCLACHSASGPESPKLDTLAQVQAAAGDIDRAAAAGPSAVNTYMPEGSSVDEAERRKLGEWLACGAPQ